LHQRKEQKLKVADKYRIRHFITCILYLSSFCQSRIGAFYTLHEPENDVNITVNLEDLDVGRRMLLKEMCTNYGEKIRTGCEE
jgi:hypothetical protein